MKCIKILFGIIWTIGTSGFLMAQNVLSPDEAVQRALENNFGIRISENNVDWARNNTSKYNTGQLPTVTANGGLSYRLDNTTANFQDGRTTSLSFAASQSANASVGANYTIFDGYFRKYNIQQLQERLELTELEVKATMENIAAQTLSQYYQIAALVENLAIISEAIEISQRRLTRSEQQFEYGQGSRLAILNAQVDLNNDSLNYFNTDIQVNNAKRLLNNLMVDMETLDYVVDQNTDFIAGLNKEALKESMLKENVALQQLDKNIEIGHISINLANARKLPTIAASASYGYSYSKNNSASFLSSQNTNGLNVGLTVGWNIFDGGTTRHALDQARINNIGLALQKEQIIENLEFEFENAWANYQNTLFIYENNAKNVAINRTNFERTEEQFKIGQINSVDFRQAQLNLLNAETVLNTSMLLVKIAEVSLLLLSGRVL